MPVEIDEIERKDPAGGDREEGAPERRRQSRARATVALERNWRDEGALPAMKARLEAETAAITKIRELKKRSTRRRRRWKPWSGRATEQGGRASLRNPDEAPEGTRGGDGPAEEMQKGGAILRRRWTRRTSRPCLQVDGHPVSKMVEGETQKLLKMEDRPASRDRPGQAVHAVANACAGHAPGLRTEAPIGSFLFLGPTGVGKTELARAWPSSSSTPRTPWCGSTCRSTGEARRRADDRRTSGLRRLRGGGTANGGPSAGAPIRSSSSTRSRRRIRTSVGACRCWTTAG